MPQETGDDRLAAIQEQLAGAVEKMLASDDWRAALEAAAKFHHYSFENVALIFAAHAEAFARGLVTAEEPTMVAGFRQWEAMGRHVLAGQHGYTILRPNRLQWRETKDPGSGEWRRLGRFERAAAGASVRQRSVLHPRKPFGLATVFDISQTDGEPIAEPPHPQLPAGTAPDGMWDGLAAQVAALGFSLRDVGSARELGGANGVTNWLDMTVTIRSDIDDLARTKVLTHELAHCSLHDPRGADGVVDQVKAAAVTRGAKEVEAESVAFLVAAAHGMDTTGYSLPYISTWASRDDGAATVRQVGTRVIAAARTILDGLPTVQVGSGRPPALDQHLEAQREQHRAHTRPARDRSYRDRDPQTATRAAPVREAAR